MLIMKHLSNGRAAILQAIFSALMIGQLLQTSPPFAFADGKSTGMTPVRLPARFGKRADAERESSTSPLLMKLINTNGGADISAERMLMANELMARKDLSEQHYFSSPELGSATIMQHQPQQHKQQQLYSQSRSLEQQQRQLQQQQLQQSQQAAFYAISPIRLALFPAAIDRNGNVLYRLPYANTIDNGY